MSGENPILLLKSVTTHSVHPRHTQTLTRGRKKVLTFNSLVEKPAGYCQGLPTQPSPCHGGTVDAGPAPRDMHWGVPTRVGRRRSSKKDSHLLGFRSSRGTAWTDCNKPKSSKIVVAALLGVFMFYKHEFIFGTQCR